MSNTSTTALHALIADHIAAVNALDEDTIVATFAADALVNDAHREFWGAEAIRRWVRKEMIGDRVTIQVTEVVEHTARPSCADATTASMTRPTFPPR